MRVQPPLGKKLCLRTARLVAALVIGLFMIDQLISAAHYHSPRDVNHFAAAGHATSADICPICLYHSSLTPAVAAAPMFAEPRCFHAALALEPERTVALEIRFTLFGRAPPAAV
jgi:hypothetical protein